MITISGTLNESTRQINASLSITAGAKDMIFISNEVKTITNTTVKTFLNSVTDYQGTYTLPANTLLKGDMIELRVSGEISTGVSQQATVEIALDGNVLKTSLETLPNSLNGMFFDLYATIRIISATQALLVGRTFIQTVSGVAAPVMRNINSDAPVTIDVTKANDVNVSYQWAAASASNILRVDMFSIKKIRI